MRKRRKYALIILDGAADDPLPELEGKTPLQVAHIPHLDRIAALGRVGLVRTIPEGMPAGSDIATLSILGFDPRRYHTGRAPLEAVEMGIPLNPEDVAFRCNLVTVQDQVLLDYSAGEIPTDQAQVLVRYLDEKLSTRRLQFYPGISYRHIMVWRQGSADVLTQPPHDIMGQPVAPNLPQGDGESTLRQLISDSRELLEDHDINRRRREAGLPPANMIWLWGQGRAPRLPSFAASYGLAAVAIAAVALPRGVARAAGFTLVNVPGATGDQRTDYAGKGRAAQEALAQADLVLVHVEAPDEAAHHGDVAGKIRAIEQIDREVVARVLDTIGQVPAFRVLALPDHVTALHRGHSGEPVPFALAGQGIEPDAADRFDEQVAAESGERVEEGYTLMGRLVL